MINIINTEIEIGAYEIAKIEKILGYTFPNEYKKHILKFNGGQCNPNKFKFDNNGTIEESSIDWFLAIYDGEYDNLAHYIQIYKIQSKRMPSDLFPIAHDPGGNLICISSNPKSYGFIYFWDHESEINEYSDIEFMYENIYLISNSFKQFLSSLF